MIDLNSNVFLLGVATDVHDSGNIVVRLVAEGVPDKHVTVNEKHCSPVPENGQVVMLKADEVLMPRDEARSLRGALDRAGEAEKRLLKIRETLEAKDDKASKALVAELFG